MGFNGYFSSHRAIAENPFTQAFCTNHPTASETPTKCSRVLSSTDSKRPVVIGIQ